MKDDEMGREKKTDSMPHLSKIYANSRILRSKRVQEEEGMQKQWTQWKEHRVKVGNQIEISYTARDPSGLRAAAPMSLIEDLSSAAYSKSTEAMLEMPLIGTVLVSTVRPNESFARIAIFAWTS